METAANYGVNAFEYEVGLTLLNNVLHEEGK